MNRLFKKYWLIGAVLACLVIANVLVQVRVFRWDLTDDKLYSLSDASKALLHQTEAPIEVTLLLDGELSAGFAQLRRTAEETLEEMNIYAAHGLHVKYLNVNTADEALQYELQQQGVAPYAEQKKEYSGKTVIYNTFPYAVVTYKGYSIIVRLFTPSIGQDRTVEDDLNAGMQQLEFVFMEAIYQLQQPSWQRIGILDGHNEGGERYTYDLQQTLSEYFDVRRVAYNKDSIDVHLFDGFKALVIVDPRTAFNDAERFVLDQYIMRGGAILWAVDGVQVNREMLQENGYTPILVNDVNLTEMFYRYGVNIESALVQDLQCSSMLLNVSADPSVPNLQPFSWTYAPILQAQPDPIITGRLGYIKSLFSSRIKLVGNDESIQRRVLLTTSDATKVTSAPNEVNLNDFNPDIQSFRERHLPVAISLEGAFPSMYAHRMIPRGVKTSESIRKQSVPTRQIIIASSSILKNEWQSSSSHLPMGFDRVLGMQMDNREFAINSVLWLTGLEDMIPLRAKSVTLRLLNTQRAYAERTKIERVSTIVPVAILLALGGVIWVVRKRKYGRRI